MFLESAAIYNQIKPLTIVFVTLLNMFGVGYEKKKKYFFIVLFSSDALHSKHIQFKSSVSKDFLIVTKHFYSE